MPSNEPWGTDNVVLGVSIEHGVLAVEPYVVIEFIAVPFGKVYDVEDVVVGCACDACKYFSRCTEPRCSALECEGVVYVEDIPRSSE